MSRNFIEITETDYGSKARAKKATEMFPKELTAQARWKLVYWWEQVLATARALCPVKTGTLQATGRIEETDPSIGAGSYFERGMTVEDTNMISKMIVFGGLLVNPDTGRICVPIGTKIFANPSLELIPIENLSINSKIWDSQNNFQFIGETFSHEYDGDLIRIKALGILPFDVTPEHEILIALWKSWVINQSYFHIIEEISWRQGNDLKLLTMKDTTPNLRRKRTCVIFPKYKKSMKQWINIFGRKNVELTPKLARLFGLFIAEGSTYIPRKHGGRFTFTFGNHELKLINFVKQTLNSFGINVGLQKRWATTIYKDNLEMTMLLREYFGSKSWTKKIPNFIMDSTTEVTKAFILGICEGDGCKTQDGIFICTVSETLAIQIQKLLSKLDIFGTITKHKIINDSPSDLKIISRHDRYIICIRGKQIEKLGFRHNKKQQSYIMEDENNFYLPIRKIETVPYKGLVWNIKTKDKTFQISNILVHNCDYAQAVHDGHFTRSGRWIPPTPFIEMAIQIHMQELDVILGKSIDDTINTVWVGE